MCIVKQTRYGIFVLYEAVLVLKIIDWKVFQFTLYAHSFTHTTDCLTPLCAE